MEAAKRFADADERADETRETWILVRDAAVMMEGPVAKLCDNYAGAIVSADRRPLLIVC